MTFLRGLSGATERLAPALPAVSRKGRRASDPHPSIPDALEPAACIRYLREQRISLIEATLEAQNDWVAHVNTVASATLYPQANSWYMGANVPGKARVFMPYAGGVGAYRKKCDDVAAAGYDGFALTSLPRQRANAPGPALSNMG